MDIKGFLYELARRPDSEELRSLGRELLVAAHASGDACLALGFLVNDWKRLVEESATKVDGQVDGQVASLHRSPGLLQ